MNSATECPSALEFVPRSTRKRVCPHRIILPAMGWLGGWLFLLLLQGPLAGMVLHTEQDAEATTLESKSVIKGPVEVKLRLSPAKPKLSDTVQLEVEVAFEKGVEVKPPAFGQAVGDFIVRNYKERKSKSDDTRGQAEPRRADSLRTERRVFQYDLEPTQSGRHLVRSIAIEFVDQRIGSEAEGQVAVIESETLELEVVSEWAGKTPDLDQLDPMFEPRPIDASSPWKWLGVALPIVAIGLAALWWLRKKQAPVAQVRKKSPSEIAQESLAILLVEKLPEQGRFQEFYLRLTASFGSTSKGQQVSKRLNRRRRSSCEP